MPSEPQQASSFKAPEGIGTSRDTSLPSFREKDKQVHVHMHTDMAEIIQHVRNNPDFEHVVTGIMSRNRHVVVARS